MKSDERGFTLVEIIVAVAILAVLSAGVVSLFIVSHVRLQKAMDLDNAVLETNTLIEEFQGVEGSSSNGSRFTIYYDDNWERSVIMDSEAQYAIYGNIIQLSEDQEGLLHLDLRAVRLKPYPFENNEKHEIYSIGVIIEDLSYWSE
ncbi:MAG TPA: prepilin-type N-terminal cleavage/methylation domain-containing protein [Clostridiaceae bacterium]|nr:prepilin-type N-terminal cleavage/methylation domain-containing protein [Clostridiaceae bacterium]